MVDTLTPTYQFVLPEIGGSDDTWGDKLNANFTAIDALFSDIFTGGSPGEAGTFKSIIIAEAAPVLRIEETDQTDPTGRYRFAGIGGEFLFQRSVAVDWSGGGQTVWGFNPSSNILTFTKELKLESAVPILGIFESDQVAPAGQYRHIVSGDIYSFQRALTANHASNTDIFTYNGATGLLTFAAPLAGLDIRGNINDITGSSPRMRFNENDQTDPAGRYQIIASGDVFALQRATAAAWASVESIIDYAGQLDRMRVYKQLEFTEPSNQLRAAPGVVNFDMDHLSTGANNCVHRFGRSTNTTGTYASQWYVGNNTTTAAMILNHKTGALTTITGTIGPISDADTKEDVQNLGPALSLLQQFRAISYKVKGRPELGRIRGFVAQELEQVLPDLVFDVHGTEDAPTVKAFNMLGITPLLVKALQEINARLEAAGI